MMAKMGPRTAVAAAFDQAVSAAGESGRAMVDEPRPPGPEIAEPAGPMAVVITGEDWLDRICPFLRARDGSWRSASPMREHRCWATDPPSELPVLTQQRLCLMRAHDGCERFLHARELRSESLALERRGRGSGRDGSVPLRTVSARTVAPAGVSRFVDRLVEAAVRIPRVAWVGGALAATGVVIVLVMGFGGAGGRPVESQVVRPSVLEPTVSLPVVVGDASPGVDGLRRYRVRDGDTLRTIADRFGISVRQLRAVNQLGDPPQLTVGEVLVIPPAG